MRNRSQFAPIPLRIGVGLGFLFRGSERLLSHTAWPWSFAGIADRLIGAAILAGAWMTASGLIGMIRLASLILLRYGDPLPGILSKEAALLSLAVLASLVLMGSGPYSWDRRRRRLSGRNRDSETQTVITVDVPDRDHR